MTHQICTNVSFYLFIFYFLSLVMIKTHYGLHCHCHMNMIEYTDLCLVLPHGGDVVAHEEGNVVAHGEWRCGGS